MAPNKRERENARRRYEAYQKRLAERAALRAKRKRQSMIATIAAGAVAVIAIGVFAVVQSGGDDETEPTAQPTATATDTPSATATPTTTNPAGLCPEPTTTPPATPKSFDTVPALGDAKGKTFTVTLTTSCGEITLALDGNKAPQAVASTVFLAKNGFYDASRCHRLTGSSIFVLQCGDPTGTGSGSPGYSYGPIENAPADGVYKAGTVAMARQGGNAESMGSQFFLVYKDSPIPSDAAGGYTVMGTITSGLDVVQQVADAGEVTGGGDGAPNTPISIDSVTVSEP